MKNPLHYIQQYPHRTKQLLGLTYDQFGDLLAQAEMHHKQIQFEIERKKMRINQKGGGRKLRTSAISLAFLVRAIAPASFVDSYQ